MDRVYSITLLVSLLAGALALVGALARRMRAAKNLAVLAWIAVAVSFTVHLAWGHTPGSPAALAPWAFVREHVSFLVAAALPAVVLLVGARRGERRGTWWRVGRGGRS